MRKQYADIIVDISQEKLDKTFQYEIPRELENRVEIGKKVRIPFGNGDHERKGYVIGLSDEAKFDLQRMKEIRGVSSGEETTESKLIALAAWMREYYGSTMIQALKTVLPVQEKIKAKEKRQSKNCIFLVQTPYFHHKQKESTRMCTLF